MIHSAQCHVGDDYVSPDGSYFSNNTNRHGTRGYVSGYERSICHYEKLRGEVGTVIMSARIMGGKQPTYVLIGRSAGENGPDITVTSANALLVQRSYG